DARFEEQLAHYNFRVVALSRHPLDVLVSILAFSQHDVTTLQWLNGAGGNEVSLEGATPVSPAFLDYAVGRRASALLNVSADWNEYPGVWRARYEALVENPAAELRRLVSETEPDGQCHEERLAAALAQNTAREMRSRTVNEMFHVWQARPGLWR